MRKRVAIVAHGGRIAMHRDPLAAHATSVERDRACRDCGYGVAGGRRPERCPMCGGHYWQLGRDRRLG